jgi:hypothetical protein
VKAASVVTGYAAIAGDKSICGRLIVHRRCWNRNNKLQPEFFSHQRYRLIGCGPSLLPDIAVSGGKSTPLLRLAEATAGACRHEDGVAGGERLKVAGRNIREIDVDVRARRIARAAAC